jgi:hypothetical protein
VSFAVFRRPVAIGAVVCLAGFACRESLPTAPTDLEIGVIVYEHADFLGQSAHITVNIDDLKDFKGPCMDFTSGTPGDTRSVWNDCISSIRLAPGWRANLYEHDNFDGEYFAVTEDISDLRFAGTGCKTGFNDCTTSIRVFAP